MNPADASPQSRTSAAYRGVAWLAVAMVLFLSVLEVSPAAHAWLHGDADEAEHTCAITLFSHGVTAAAVVVLAMAVVLRWTADRRVAREIFVGAPAFLHQPGRAPPTV